MNEYETIKKQLEDINNKRVRLQTLKEQAQQECQRIEKKYNVTSSEQLSNLYNEKQNEYNKLLEEVNSYITETQTVLSQYQGII